MTHRLTTDKPQTKCGGLLSVRILTALMCAFLIITATTATLAITFHFSIIVTNNVASKHAVGITARAKGAVENFLNRPLSLVEGMQYIIAKGNRVLPKDEESQNPMWYQKYWDTFIIAFRGSDFQYDYVGIGFEDGSNLNCRTNNDDGQFRCEYVFWGNRSLSGKNGESITRTHTFLRSDLSIVEESVSTTTYDPRTSARYKQVPRIPGTIKWNPVYLTVEPIMPSIALSGVLFNESGIMFGVMWINIAVHDIDQFIDDIVTTPGSVSVLIDNEDILLSSSHTIPFLTMRNISTSYNETLPYNCMKNTMKDKLNAVLMCRETINSYPYPPLRELKSTNPKIIDNGTGNNSRLMTLDGADYFVTVAPIVTPMASGMHWRIILFLPKVDIAGGIIEASNLAMGVSIVIVIFAVIASFLIIALLLRPLNVLAEDMYRVATLKDMGDVPGDHPVTTVGEDTRQLNNGTTKPSLSFLSEIANLQFAFNAMRSELGKIKSYLPQSVLAQLYGGDDSSDEGGVDQEQLSFKQGTSSMVSSSFGYSGRDLRSTTDNLSGSSRRLGSKYSGSFTEEDNVSTSNKERNQNPTLNIGISLSQRRVTMMSLNIIGYHVTLSSKNNTQIDYIHSTLVTAVSSACTENRGVMDGFHGDRFLASFNAVTNVGNHIVHGAHAAYNACRAVETMNTPLTMTAGLASGSALVGNMGSTTIKRFTVLGHVVSTAVTLERLAKRYRASGGVLVGGAAVVDLENFFNVLMVDAAVLPISAASAGCRSRIAAVMSLKSAASDEWMYELQEGNERSCYGDANRAFSAFLEGNHAEASMFVEKVLDGNHDPDSTSVGEILRQLMTEEPVVDGKLYVSPMSDYYYQCVLPSGKTSVNMSAALVNSLKSTTNSESRNSSILMRSSYTDTSGNSTHLCSDKSCVVMEMEKFGDSKNDSHSLFSFVGSQGAVATPNTPKMNSCCGSICDARTVYPNRGHYDLKK